MDSLPAWQHPYPMLLVATIGLSLLFGLVQCVWRPFRAWARYYSPLLAGGLCVLLLWDLVTEKLAWMPQPFFPGPDEVLGGLIEDRGVLLTSAGHSLLLLLAGYALGVCVGLVGGVVVGWFALARYWGMPALKFIGPIPATALVPLAMMLSRDSFVCGMALIGWAAAFPVTMLTLSGIANVRLSYLDVARTLGASRLFLIFRVAIPAAMPSIFIGLFMGLLAAFLTLIIAETVGVKSGLGFYLQLQKGYAEYGKVYASLLIMALFFSTLLSLLFKARDWALKWQRGVIKW